MTTARAVVLNHLETPVTVYELDDARGALLLTQNFALGEFSVSQSHPELVIPVPNRYGPNVVRLAVFHLQPMRTRYNRAIGTLSSFRSPALNAKVGGSPTSQHIDASAVDWTTRGLREIYEDMVTGKARLDPAHTGQVIYYPDRNFIHSALPSERYPRPTFCVHWPARGHTYRVVADLPALRRLLD